MKTPKTGMAVFVAMPHVSKTRKTLRYWELAYAFQFGYHDKNLDRLKRNNPDCAYWKINIAAERV